jgi:hypothetical protein
MKKSIKCKPSDQVLTSKLDPFASLHGKDVEAVWKALGNNGLIYDPMNA